MTYGHFGGLLSKASHGIVVQLAVRIDKKSQESVFVYRIRNWFASLKSAFNFVFGSRKYESVIQICIACSVVIEKVPKGAIPPVAGLFSHLLRAPIS